MFTMTTAIAADTGVHLGDGSLYIRQNGRDTNYVYSITGNAVEDQLYLLGHVIPTIEVAYDVDKFGIHLAPEATWMSIVYQSKKIALFKHRTLGLPNGRKIDPSIPRPILDDNALMKHCVRELLATDGVLGFYSASKSGVHKYSRIQITMTAWRVVEQLAKFLRQQIGINASCRFEAEPGSSVWRPRHRLQVNGSANIEKWRKEIGFSNPSHISRLMTFEKLGECPPRTSILDRLSYLTGCSSGLRASGPLPRSAFESAVSEMRRGFGSPDLNAHQTIKRIQCINRRLQHLARELPRIVESRNIES
jgi:hypothetical protein